MGRERLIIEGTVDDSYRIQTWLASWLGLAGVRTEPLPDPEPAWWPPQAGDVMNMGGNTWLRGPAGVWHCALPVSAADDDEVLTRIRHRNDDVTLLVRHGEPYDEEAERTSDGFATGRYARDGGFSAGRR
jgi:hypothetical protein